MKSFALQRKRGWSSIPRLRTTRFSYFHHLSPNHNITISLLASAHKAKGGKNYYSTYEKKQPKSLMTVKKHVSELRETSTCDDDSEDPPPHERHIPVSISPPPAKCPPPPPLAKQKHKNSPVASSNRKCERLVSFDQWHLLRVKSTEKRRLRRYKVIHSEAVQMTQWCRHRKPTPLPHQRSVRHNLMTHPGRLTFFTTCCTFGTLLTHLLLTTHTRRSPVKRDPGQLFLTWDFSPSRKLVVDFLLFPLFNI